MYTAMCKTDQCPQQNNISAVGLCRGVEYVRMRCSLVIRAPLVYDNSFCPHIFVSVHFVAMHMLTLALIMLSTSSLPSVYEMFNMIAIVALHGAAMLQPILQLATGLSLEKAAKVVIVGLVCYVSDVRLKFSFV